MISSLNATTVCSTSATTTTITVTSVTDTSTGSKTGFPGGYREIKSIGCPGYNWKQSNTVGTADQQSLDFKFPLTPTLSTSPIYIGIYGANGASNSSPVMGPVGLTVTGVQIYSNSDANKRNAYIYEGSSFDTCGGHPDPNGNYHYHVQPTNSSSCGPFVQPNGVHSPLFGFMADGIPIYGPYGDNGVAPTNLDYCGGHVDNTYGFYHYHLPANKASPYTINCLMGCVLTSNSNGALNSYVKTYSSCSKNTTAAALAEMNYTSLSTWGVGTQVTDANSESNSSTLKISLLLIAFALLF